MAVSANTEIMEQISEEDSNEDVHTFSCEEEAGNFITNYELETCCTYVKQKSRNLNVSEIESLKGRTIYLKDVKSKGPKIQCDGTPFVILGNELRECCYGPPRHKKLQRDTEDTDHDFGKRRRRVVQNTKKMGCPSKIIIRRIMKFPDYNLIGPFSKHAKSIKVNRLKEEFCSETRAVLEVLVKIERQHSEHIQGPNAGFSQMIDERVKNFIVSLVENGSKNVDEIDNRIKDYVPSIATASQTNRRLYPSRKTIYNIVYNTMNSSRYINDDQLKSEMCESWSLRKPNDKVYFRTSSDFRNDCKEPSSLLFVYQTAFQQQMLLKYGKEIAVLDATYNTSRYDIPLFQLCVLTNCGYVVVGAFIVSRETTANIAEALDKLKEWNPDWQPSYLLQTISRCATVEDYTNETTSLRETTVYQSNEKLQNWLERRWFIEHARWVRYCRKDLVNLRINTTNGLERQHRILKENYLKKSGFGGSLDNLLTVLVEKFFPALEIRYKEENVKSMSTSRLYSKNVPSFLKDKPKAFVKHFGQIAPKNRTY